MGSYTYNAEHTSSVPPQRLFKALVLDADNLIPKVVPDSIKSSEKIEGDGGPGTVKKVTFPEGSHIKFVKHRIDAIDESNYTYNYTVFDGDGMENTMEKIVYEIKMVPSGGGTAIKSARTYHTKGDHKLNEEYVKKAEAKAAQLFKAVDDYLAANPTEYN